MGIANKVVSLVTLLLVGFAAGAQPIMGYSYGAKNNKRLGELLRFLFKAAVIGGFVGGAIYSKLWVRVLKVWFLPLGDKELSLFQLYT